MQAILDDQIVKTQSMRASPFIGPLEGAVTEWDELLNRLQEVLDNWQTCQATWQYLEPIFTSPDILKQMPEEGEKFLQVTGRLWGNVWWCAAGQAGLPMLTCSCKPYALLSGWLLMAGGPQSFIDCLGLCR